MQEERNGMPGTDDTGGDTGDSLRGTVERVIYTNGDTGYTVCDFGLEDGDVVTVYGTMPYIGNGDELTVWGGWTHSPRYGRQFRVDQYERSLPADSNAILRYLSSRTVKGVGPALAKRMVDTFGDETLEVMENHPDWLVQVQGISRKKANEISEDFRAKAGIRAAMLFFREYFGVDRAHLQEVRLRRDGYCQEQPVPSVRRGGGHRVREGGSLCFLAGR